MQPVRAIIPGSIAYVVRILTSTAMLSFISCTTGLLHVHSESKKYATVFDGILIITLLPRTGGIAIRRVCSLVRP